MTEITRQQMVEAVNQQIDSFEEMEAVSEQDEISYYSAKVILWKAIRAALTEQQAQALPGCRKCGAPACCEIRPTNIPADFTPYCRNCADAEHGTCQSIANHEMQNFGGAYGVPGIEERPIEAARRKGV